MPTYNVIETNNDDLPRSIILTMKADSITSIPTEITGSHGMDLFAWDIVKKDNATVQQIAARCGSYSALVEVNPVEEAIARGRAAIDARHAAKVKKDEPEAEIDLTADGALDDDDEGYDEDELHSPRWMTVYDLASGWCTITAAQSELGYRTPELLEVDQGCSDPDGKFVVHVGVGRGDVVMIRIAIDADGPIRMVEGFSWPPPPPSLWPRGSTHFVYWSDQDLWPGGRRPARFVNRPPGTRPTATSD